MKVEFYMRVDGDGEDWRLRYFEVPADGWREHLLAGLAEELADVELPEFPPVGATQ